MQEMERQQYGGAHAQKLPATPENNLTNEAKESIATPPSSPDLLECSACHEMLGATDFSKTQLKRGCTRRCKSCTGSPQTPPRSASQRAAPVGFGPVVTLHHRESISYHIREVTRCGYV
jgi:hypothetical protein